MARELSNLLGSLGLGHYTKSFAENGIDFDLLPELTNEDLKDLGSCPPSRPQAVA